MNKNICVWSLALMVSAWLISCGDKTNGDETEAEQETVEEKDPFAEKCSRENNITVTINGYGYGMSGDYAFETASFEVRQSSWLKTSDSTAELRLSNYTAAGLTGERKDDQVDIVVKLASKGKKLEAGVFPYMKYDAPAYAMVTMQTAKGTVYFNWLAGMPEQGNVTIDYLDDQRVCGSFALAVEKPDDKTIGVVRLNGSFSVGETR